MRHLIFKYSIIFLFLLSLNTFRIIAQTTSNRISVNEYINTYKNLAQQEMKRSGIPASITLAQAIHESDCGNSFLAIKGNNHFGIKCHASWEGHKIYKDDDSKNECFRKYKSVYESYKDHSDFIKQSPRYQALFSLEITDYKAWAIGFKTAGYATNPNYAQLIIKIIEDYKLFELDTDNHIILTNNTQQKAKCNEREVYFNNRIKYIIVKQGDSFYKIANEFNISLERLYKYNELTENAVIKEGDRLYLQPKRRNASPENKIHIVQQGETVYSVSQLYGIKTKFLLQKNHLMNDEKLVPGQKLFLRKTPINH